ncbi:MAG: hypothetical protein JRK53_02610 [Deltaproteobacteria bacterium]|nr:hypothetical protein [Deltaproteobacteria bacterium]MBW1817645.1 hypothetical protein [Deltaproteobacteria bacterium]MBW2283627.1 hypothetical protein [Deltaproteobacteria bacterium]
MEQKYSFENVWQRVSTDLNNEIIEFWKRNHALPSGEDPEERADQVVLVVRNERHEIIAVNTAVKIFAKRFRNSFYFYRTMTAGGFRNLGVAEDMLNITRDFFEALFKKEKTKTCIGILLTVESEILAARFRQAIRPTKFIFMGYNENGYQLRVYYFEGAEI